MYKLTDYSFELPKELIAQNPPKLRGKSRLMLMDRYTGKVNHHNFDEISSFLKSTDLLVVNDTKTITSKLFGKKNTGGSVEILVLNFTYFLKYLSERSIILNCILKTSRKAKKGTEIFFEKGLKGLIVNYNKGLYGVKFSNGILLKTVIYKFGKIPIPPYIKRKKNINDKRDRLRYQTIYAQNMGSIATPTAGLHFSKKIIENIKKIGVKIVTITLHVGYGTFSPIISEDIREHVMHSEWFSIGEEAANAINTAKNNGYRILAVGTTTVRTLEFVARHQGNIITETNGNCNLFIYPGYKFRVVDALLTNFHFPQSTLLLLISAFSNREKILNAYKTAIKNKYFFYSYGDAMLIS